MAQAIVSEASLAGLAIGDLTFQERLQFRQRAFELIGNAHQRAGFLDARDRSVEDVDLGHRFGKIAAALCSTGPARYARNVGRAAMLSSRN